MYKFMLALGMLCGATPGLTSMEMFFEWQESQEKPKGLTRSPKVASFKELRELANKNCDISLKYVIALQKMRDEEQEHSVQICIKKCYIQQSGGL